MQLNVLKITYIYIYKTIYVRTFQILNIFIYFRIFIFLSIYSRFLCSQCFDNCTPSSPIHVPVVVRNIFKILNQILYSILESSDFIQHSMFRGNLLSVNFSSLFTFALLVISSIEPE